MAEKRVGVKRGVGGRFVSTKRRMGARRVRQGMRRKSTVAAVDTGAGTDVVVVNVPPAAPVSTKKARKPRKKKGSGYARRAAGGKGKRGIAYSKPSLRRVYGKTVKSVAKLPDATQAAISLSQTPGDMMIGAVTGYLDNVPSIKQRSQRLNAATGVTLKGWLALAGLAGGAAALGMANKPSPGNAPMVAKAALRGANVLATVESYVQGYTRAAGVRALLEHGDAKAVTLGDDGVLRPLTAGEFAAAQAGQALDAGPVSSESSATAISGAGPYDAFRGETREIGGVVASLAAIRAGADLARRIVPRVNQVLGDDADLEDFLRG